MSKLTADQHLWLKAKKGHTAQRARERRRRSRVSYKAHFRAHQKGGTRRRLR